MTKLKSFCFRQLNFLLIDLFDLNGSRQGRCNASCIRMGYFIHACPRDTLFLETGSLLAHQPTSHDAVKPTEIRGDIQTNTVTGNVSSQVKSNTRNLGFLAGPYPWVRSGESMYAVFGARVYDRRLKQTNMFP